MILTSEKTNELIRKAGLHLGCYAAFTRMGTKIAKHHMAVINKLHQIERGEIDRLMITMPPRHGKTYFISESFPAYYLGRNPTKYFLFCTYNQQYANEIGRKVRNQLINPVYNAIFPDSTIDRDNQSIKAFSTTSGGAYFAMGIGGSLTGRGAHILLIDDPVKNQKEADSVVIREMHKAWYSSTAYTRLMPGGAIIIVQTRWHEDDLAGHLLSEHSHENWDIINLPAIAEYDDCLGREIGDPLWPGANNEMFTEEKLNRIMETLTDREWSALYQQKPVPASGNMVKFDWFGEYANRPAGKFRTVQSWDTAYKVKQINDPSACTTWDETEEGHYLVDGFSKRMQYPELKKTIKNKAAEFSPDAILIEDKASGISLIQELRNETRLPIIAIEPDGDKITRMNAASGEIESGRTFLPESAGWLSKYTYELTSFPLAEHDDYVDSTSQYLTWAKKTNYRPVISSAGTRTFGRGNRGGRYGRL